MKNMRRMLAVLMAVAMMLTAMPAFAATMIFSEGDMSDFYLNWMTMYDGRLFLFSYDGEYVVWSADEGISDVRKLDIEELAGEDEAEDEDESSYYNRNYSGFVGGEDGMYVMVYTYLIEQDLEEDYYGSWLEKAEFIRLDVAEDGELSFSDDRTEMEWDDMVESYDDSEYAQDMQMPFIKNGRVIFSTYTDNGYGLGVYEIESGEGEIVSMDFSVETFCPYKDGALLVSRDYDNYEAPPEMHYYNVETGESEEMGEIPSVEYTNPSSLVYSEENDTLYFTLNGCLWGMPSLDAEQAMEIGAVPTNGWSSFPAFITADGSYICGDYQNISAMSVDPSDRPEASITVVTSYNNYMDEAYFKFTTSHTDVEVVKAASYSDIVKAMMNKDSSVDIYTLSLADNGYKAVFDRGYMAELDGSAVISELVGKMYPALQEAVVKDGVIYGVPVSMYTGGSAISYDPVAFEKAGFTEEDVPETVMELIQLFQRMPEVLAANEELSIFQPYMTQQDVKYSLFYQIIGMYGQAMMKGDVEKSFDSELLRSLMEEFEKIDFNAMNLPEDYEEDYEWVPEDEHRVLFETYADISSQTYVLNNVWRPMLVALDEGMEPIIDANLDIAFVNPYSENRELAIEFLEMTVSAFQQRYLNNICPDENEPIRNEYYEENLQYYNDEIEAMYAEMEKAGDDETKAMWQEQITEMENWRDEYETEGAWDVTEESLAYYKQYAGYMYPARSLGLEGDAQETYYDQIWKYIEGTVSYEEMLNNIDDKLKMMLMEDM